MPAISEECRAFRYNHFRPLLGCDQWFGRKFVRIGASILRRLVMPADLASPGFAMAVLRITIGTVSKTNLSFASQSDDMGVEMEYWPRKGIHVNNTFRRVATVENSLRPGLVNVDASRNQVSLFPILLHATKVSLAVLLALSCGAASAQEDKSGTNPEVSSAVKPDANPGANPDANPEVSPAVNPAEAIAVPEKVPASLEAEVDENYSLLGEFVGTVAISEGKQEPLGLQIRPIGNNNFDALQYAGGLPGQELYKPELLKLVGTRSGDFVILSGGPWAIFVEKDHCLLVSREGNRIGRLERIVRTSPTLGAEAPKDAIILFDGKNTDQFVTANMTEDGLLIQGAEIKPMLNDFNLHVEFKLPYMPAKNDQERGNSGIYLQSRYEMQVLDSFAQETKFNGCGSIYRYKAPDLNMCLPPLQWQTYDIVFTAPRWAADGTKIRNATVTSWLNGIKIQDNVSIENKTGAGKPEEPVLLPTKIQDHKDQVRFRNIWAIDRGLATGEFPVVAKLPSEQAAEVPQTGVPDAVPEVVPEKVEVKVEETEEKPAEPEAPKVE